MARKQTRRSISMSADAYERLKLWCEQHNRSMSSMVEQLLNDFLHHQRGENRPVRRDGNVFTF